MYRLFVYTPKTPLRCVAVGVQHICVHTVRGYGGYTVRLYCGYAVRSMASPSPLYPVAAKKQGLGLARRLGSQERRACVRRRPYPFAAMSAMLFASMAGMLFASTSLIAIFFFRVGVLAISLALNTLAPLRGSKVSAKGASPLWKPLPTLLFF